uniref:Metalloendopeptidase n=1 Tax=Strongyloides stercoralis TaxID=6248 RepID=A0A0K0EPX8_STRER
MLNVLKRRPSNYKIQFFQCFLAIINMKSIIYIHISIIISSILIVVSRIIKLNFYFFLDFLDNKHKFNFQSNFRNFKRDIFYDKGYLWERPIKYYVDKSYMKNNIKKAILDIQNNTCITFEERHATFNGTQGLIFVEGQSCLSFYGLQNPNYSQYIWLSSKCYISPFIILLILHEIGHALGLMHEHARMDRDKFISIDFSQLDNHGKENFKIRNDTTYYRNYSVFYDYASIMHYDRYEFGSFWKWLFGIPVMKSRLYEQYTWMMGQREKATFNDYKQINLLHCNWCGYADNRTGKIINKDSFKCKNSGYPDFRNCSRCICPTGYTGDSCEKVIDSDSKCNETIFYANETRVPLLFAYKMDCYIKIKPIENFTNVEFSVLYVNAPPYKGDICVESSAFQIKYRRDRGATGLLLCGHDSRTLTVTSESKTILFFYTGIDDHSFIQFAFRAVNKTRNN